MELQVGSQGDFRVRRKLSPFAGLALLVAIACRDPGGPAFARGPYDASTLNGAALPGRLYANATDTISLLSATLSFVRPDTLRLEVALVHVSADSSIFIGNLHQRVDWRYAVRGDSLTLTKVDANAIDSPETAIELPGPSVTVRIRPTAAIDAPLSTLVLDRR